MKFLGYSRIRNVYPIWFCLSFAAGALMLWFKLRYPEAIFLIVLVFLAKDILFDYKLINIVHPRVYWAEHAPLVFCIGVIGLLRLTEVSLFEGYVSGVTTLLAFIDFSLNLYKDLNENPRVYS